MPHRIVYARARALVDQPYLYTLSARSHGYARSRDAFLHAQHTHTYMNTHTHTRAHAFDDHADRTRASVRHSVHVPKLVRYLPLFKSMAMAQRRGGRNSSAA